MALEITNPCHTPPPAERAQETGLAESTLRRAAAAFDTHGMISLFRPTDPHPNLWSP
jgi:hypothetical protein